MARHSADEHKQLSPHYSPHTISRVSAGASPGRNDDCVSYYIHNNDTVDLWIIDGASAVTTRSYIDHKRGDPAWFVLRVNNYFNRNTCLMKTPGEVVCLAADAVRKRVEKHIGFRTMPLYARPIAALTWVRISRRKTSWHLELYALGDCKSLLQCGTEVHNLDPYINSFEERLQRKVRESRERVTGDEHKQGQLIASMLRRRRESQNIARHPSVLCLDRQGAFAARQRHYIAACKPLRVLLMTDGFYRLVDKYHKYSNRQLLDVCVVQGLKGALRELRTCEAESTSARSTLLKKADDASAVLCEIR